MFQIKYPHFYDNIKVWHDLVQKNQFSISVVSLYQLYYQQITKSHRTPGINERSERNSFNRQVDFSILPDQWECGPGVDATSGHYAQQPSYSSYDYNSDIRDIKYVGATHVDFEFVSPKTLQYKNQEPLLPIISP